MREATNTVWVGNLEPYHTDELLRSEFAPFGRVMRIARVDGKNFLFVHFRQIDEARTAATSLQASGALGRARFNYGKQFDYSAEDLALPWSPHDPHSFFGGAERDHRPRYDDRGGAGGDDRPRYDDDRRPPKRNRDDEHNIQPSNVLWAANIPASMSTDELRQSFDSFGTINNVSRVADRGMAFIHFSSVDECQHALDVMKGVPINGVVLTLNYGRPQRTEPAPGMNGGGIGGPVNFENEHATNVVYLGNIASNVTHDEVDRTFDMHPGFINAKYISGSGIAFGHFDTIDNARVCRQALQGQLLGGAPFRVNFGKTNHTMTMADRRPGGASGNAHLQPGAIDLASIDPFNASALFALTTTNAPTTFDEFGNATGGGGALVTIPAMGSGGALTLTGGSNVPKYFTRDRPSPVVSLDSRITALTAATYHNCGEPEKNLRPNVVQSLCDAIDNCVDATTEENLDREMSYFAPLNAAHLFALCAKRLHEFFADDRHKKLFVLYAATRVLLGTRTTQLAFSKQSMWSFLVLLSVVSVDQDEAGLAAMKPIVDKLKTASAFHIANKLDDAFLAEFIEQLDVVLERAKVDQEMAQFARRKRK